MNRKHDRYAFAHIYDRIFLGIGIQQRLTKVNHPWINGQVDCINPPRGIDSKKVPLCKVIASLKKPLIRDL